MGNTESSPRASGFNDDNSLKEDSAHISFPGSALVESALTLQCGKLDDEGSDDESNLGRRNKKTLAAKFLSHAENCVMSPQNSELETQDSDNDGDNGIRHPDSGSADDANHFFDDEYEELGRGRIKGADKKAIKKKVQPKKPESTSKAKKENNSSSLLAKSLMSEVGNPNAMSPNTMTQREMKLLKAQEKGRQHKLKYGVSALKIDSSNQSGVARPIGSPGEGVGQPSVLGSIAHAFTGNYNDPLGVSEGEKGGSDPSVLPPNSLSEHRAAQVEQKRTASGRGSSPSSSDCAVGKNTITIGLSLSRRSFLGHPDTVTRQTAFDFNELQDREYKYVSSTDSSGWKAGGGERGGNDGDSGTFFGEDYNGMAPTTIGNGFKSPGAGTPSDHTHKVAAPDAVHIPIIQIDAESPQAIDAIISALARGEIFIPHMAIIPEALSVNGVSPPDLVVRFGTERNEDLPPDEWPNWCLEFMHNQLYEYFHGMGARWMKRPFSITLAKKVRWKTVKHMNRYFSHAERVIDAWREKGPQYLDPQLAYIEGGATPEEVARPHGIYLLRNGVPTNYFSPNFNPPYTTKMTRSLLFNVLGKSWDKKRREWSSMPIPKLITPSMLVTAMCGCTDNQASGFVATEATLVNGPLGRSTTLPEHGTIRSLTPQNRTPKKTFGPSSPPSSKKKKKKNRNQQPEKRNFDTNGISNVAIASKPNSENHQMRTENPSQTKMRATHNPSGTADETKGTLSPRLELQISSSSASFFDGVPSDSNDIPSPPFRTFAEKQENNALKKRGPEPKQLKALQNSHQSLAPKEQRQDKQHEQRPEDDNNEANDENSGDSKNHEVNGERKNKFDDKMMKKKQETKLASDEEWLNDVGKILPKTEYKTMASLQAEQRRQIEVRSVVQAYALPRGVDPVCEAFRDSAIGAGSPTVRSNNSSKSGRNAMLTKNNEMGTLSMEYSVDESTLIGCDKSVGDSTLLGQNFAVESKSCLSSTTNKQLVTPKHILGDEAQEKSQQSVQLSAGTGSSSYSTFEEEVVPSDEELFAAGWAKALDPNSGSHYYFTLDRKKTCWDNPLAPPVSPTNSEESSVGEI